MAEIGKVEIRIKVKISFFTLIKMKILKIPIPLESVIDGKGNIIVKEDKAGE